MASGDKPEVMYYTTARMQGMDVAGLTQRAGGAGQRRAWNVYIATDDVDATVKKGAAACSVVVRTSNTRVIER